MKTSKNKHRYLEWANENGIIVIGEYDGATTPINHVCNECGRKDWKVAPTNMKKMRNRRCIICARKQVSDSEYKDKALKVGITVIGKYINSRTPINHQCPICKRTDWVVAPNNILRRRYTKCKKCSSESMKINDYRDTVKGLGITVLEDYINSSTPIRHQCTVCNRTDWEVAPHSILNMGVRMCISCKNELRESVMASVLKQVLKHEYTDTVFEYDAGCIGPGGGVCRYDIYIPCKNMLIECQSRFHDLNSNNDELKKEYAVSKGYEFVAIDSRDYTPIEAIQLILPHIVEIPGYVNTNSNTVYSFSLENAQKLLDEGKTCRQVADRLGVRYDTIYMNIRRGNLIKEGKSIM